MIGECKCGIQMYQDVQNIIKLYWKESKQVLRLHRKNFGFQFVNRTSDKVQSINYIRLLGVRRIKKSFQNIIICISTRWK